MDRIKQSLLKLFPLIAACIVTLIYAIILCNKDMPISEGWYTEYAWLVNHGDVPYRDFDLLFGPVYTFIVAVYTSFFGYDIILLRYLGVIVYVALTILSYCIFRQIFSRIPAMIGAIICMLFKQTSPVEIFYDYVYFVDVFAYITILCLLKAWRCQYAYGIAVDTDESSAHSVSRKSVIFIFLCGIFSVLTFLTKQTTGAMLIIFVFLGTIGFCLCRKKKRELPKLLASEFVGGCIPAFLVVFYLVVNNALIDFYHSCFTSAISAKGGILNEAIRWIIAAPDAFIVALPCVLVVLLAALLLKNSSLSKKEIIELSSNRRSERKRFLILIASVAAILLMLFYGLYEWESLTRKINDLYVMSDPFVYASFLVPTFLFVYLVYRAIRDRISFHRDIPEQWYILLGLTGAIFAIGYAVGFSGGLAPSQVSLGCGLCFALVIHLALRSIYRKPALILAFAICLSLSACSVSLKYTQMYGWWGLEVGSIWKQTKPAEGVPLLDGLVMNERYAKCYSGVYKIAEENLTDGDTAFTFPHCPVFYDIIDCHSNTYTKVQWFDVSSAPALERDLSILQDNPPKLLLICPVPEGTIAGHERMFNAYWTKDMQDGLLELASLQYQEKGSFDLGNGYVVHAYVKNES